jgi:hypothetical protein
VRGGPRKDGRAGRAGEGACQAVQSWHLCRLYASSLQQGPIPSVLRREDAATVLIHGCGSSATSCGSVACVVVILSKAREAMRSVCTVSWLKERGRRTSLFAVRKGRGARDGWADRGRSCPTMPPSVRTSDKTSNQDRMATSMPTRGGQGGGGARRNQSIAKISVTRFSRRAQWPGESHLLRCQLNFLARVGVTYRYQSSALPLRYSAVKIAEAYR